MRTIIVIMAAVLMAGCAGSQLKYSVYLQRGASASALAARVVAEELSAEARPAAEARARTEHARRLAEHDSCLVAGRTDCPPPPPDERLILDDQLAPWVRLVAVTEAMGELAGVWGRLNRSWRANGSAPPDWNSRLCQPLGEAIQVALVLLDRLGTEVAGVWRVLAALAPEVCRIGVGEGTDGG
jgi:hypothetical protein